MRRYGKRVAWFAWWYLAISIGFALLALDHLITRDKPAGIVVRFILAAGFGLLSQLEFAAAKKKR